MDVRAAAESDLDPLARIWYAGWQEAHARILPTELARYRTLEGFRSTLQANLSRVRVAGPPGQPLGLCIVKEDELHQLYVVAEARGSGVATALLVDAEARLGAQGVEVGWLACAIGNERAARFYEKHGWCRVENMVIRLPTPDGLFPLEVWRYEKHIKEASRPAVSVAHVHLETDCMEATARFMCAIGMRPVFDGPEVSVYELRGGTHLILTSKGTVASGVASFDLMVDDLHATHEMLRALGFDPSPIERRPAIDHEAFTICEPAGHVITIYSSHASGKPI